MIGYACSEEEGPAVSCQPLEKVYEKTLMSLYIVNTTDNYE